MSSLRRAERDSVPTGGNEMQWRYFGGHGKGVFEEIWFREGKPLVLQHSRVRALQTERSGLDKEGGERIYFWA